MKILVLDDNEITRQAIKNSLHEEGHEVIETNNCVDAFRILTQDGYDLIISGILQPVLDGLQFCYRVKMNEKTKNIPIIVCVPGKIDEKEMVYLENLGADGVLDNTLPATEFVTELKHLIEDINNRRLKSKIPSLAIDKIVLQNYTKHFLQKFAGISAKYQTLFESAGDGIMILKDYKFVECNKKALEIFGCGYKEIIGTYPYDHSPEIQPDGQNSKEKAIKLMDEALEGKPMFFEWRHRRPDGSLFDAEVSLRKFELPDGIYLLALVRDITERKLIQNKLKQSEELFRAVFDSARDCIFIKNKSLKYIMVNKCVAKLFKMPCEEIIGKDDTYFYEPQMAEEIRNEDKRVLNGEVLEIFAERIIGSQKFKFHIIKVPLYDEKGNIWGLCGIARDITEHETTRENLIKSREQLKLITDNITEVIFILDMDLKFTFVSPSIRVLGYEISELLRNGIEKLLTPESYVEAMKMLKHELEIEGLPVKDLNRTRSAVLQVKCKDGTMLWAETTFKFLRDQNLKPTGILGVARDVTETFKANQELKKSYEQLDRILHGTVTALASAVEKRDPYTAGHQRRVSELVCAIAEEMGLPADMINYLRIAALLHDVGKIYVPAEILAKPTTLTPAEFEIIKTHSQVGFEILKPVDFPWPIPEIVLQHHEKNDGSGYPDGLTSDKIMLEAKILCVADIVEAMMSHRPYRAALGLDQALGDISKDKGIKFDEKIVDICIKLFREKGFKFSM
ncbi:MAG: PAS domain S-box protein [candidate division WOR-3 bacterium]|nr:PAS domain S-box protein [candidate division WOR-3 bacterium]